MFGKTKIRLKQGDITQEAVDAIVNAANSSLMGGGGVDGAIHRAGGPKILAACQKIREKGPYQAGLPTGKAVITSGGMLPAQHVVHTVGPRGSAPNRKQLLHDAYTNSLIAAKEAGAITIAFPAISTGIYGYPIQEASTIALQAVKTFCELDTHFTEIRFVLFSDQDLSTYKTALSGI